MAIIFRELKVGTPIYDEQNNKLGYSKAAAQSGISQVIFSRVCMALPGMGKEIFNLFEKMLAIVQNLSWEIKLSLKIKCFDLFTLSFKWAIIIQN